MARVPAKVAYPDLESRTQKLIEGYSPDLPSRDRAVLEYQIWRSLSDEARASVKKADGTTSHGYLGHWYRSILGTKETSSALFNRGVVYGYEREGYDVTLAWLVMDRGVEPYRARMLCKEAKSKGEGQLPKDKDKAKKAKAKGKRLFVANLQEILEGKGYDLTPPEPKPEPKAAKAKKPTRKAAKAKKPTRKKKGGFPVVTREADQFLARHHKLFEALAVSNPDQVAAELLESGEVTIRHGARAVNAALYKHLGVDPTWPVGIPRTDADLITKYGRLIGKWLVAYNRIKDDKEDLIQEFWMTCFGNGVLEKFVRRLGPGSPNIDDNQRALVGYLRQVVHNFFANWCRRKNRHFIKEHTCAPLEDGTAWEVGLTEDDPIVEFEDRLDLARTLDGIPLDGGSMEQVLTSIGTEMSNTCSLREAVLKAKTSRHRLKARQG